jgi:chromosome segregation protein
MITDQEELQLKEFLKRAEVRTMKKDLLKLREADALQEKAKIISKIKEAVKEKRQEAPQEAEMPQDNQAQTKTAAEEVLQKTAEEEAGAEEQLKKYASEEEKQQIFALESQKMQLQNQLGNLKGRQEPEYLVNENELKIEKEKIEKKLRSILNEEEKIDGEINFVSEGEQQAGNQEERKKLEEKRWQLEQSRENIEKRRWEAEKDLARIDVKIEEVERAESEIISEENALQQQMDEIENSIRQIYGGVMARNKALKAGQEALKQKEETMAAELQGQEKEKIQREQYAGPKPIPKEKKFLEKVSLKMKNKFAQMAQKEDAQRKQFLKNVEEQSKE